MGDVTRITAEKWIKNDTASPMETYLAGTMHASPVRLRGSDRLENAGHLHASPTDAQSHVLCVRKKDIIFSRGDAADTVFQVVEGRIRLSITSKNGKEATVALLGPGDFIGEEAIRTPGLARRTTALALTGLRLIRYERAEMIRKLSADTAFCASFILFLLGRNARIQDDLVDRIFNSAEKRLARVLLLLGSNGKNGHNTVLVPKISQEVLATMIGATRPRVSMLMNRFKRRGVIQYGRELAINSSLLNGLLLD